MIEREVIDGRPATVTYLKGDQEPADKTDYTYIKVIFDDGEITYAYPKRD